MSKLHLAVVALLLLAPIKIGESADSDGKLVTPEDGCGQTKVATKRIVGGGQAKPGAWPWMALLFFKGDDEAGCGGSLITSQHVLTAAHCLADDLAFVRLGEHDTRTTKDGQHDDVKVTHVVQHEEYDDDTYINDIGLLYLARAVKFTDRISPICLPIHGELLNKRFVGSNPFLAGWGYLKEAANKMSAVLMEVQIPVVSNQDCRENYRRYGQFKKNEQFDDRVVCAGHLQGGMDSCQGDSGGPLMLPVPTAKGVAYHQIGIVSWATGCAQPDLPGINANVQYYADWIKSKLAIKPTGTTNTNIFQKFGEWIKLKLGI